MDMPKNSVTAPVDSGAYTDLNRLASLKNGDRDSDANLKKVAQEFESLFVSQMLKSMRSANEVLAKDNPLNTPEAKQYQEMYDQQLAVTLSTRGNGIGLQDVLMRQLSKTKNVLPAPAGTPGDGTTAEAATTTPKTGLATSAYQRPLWATRSSAADLAAAATGVPRNDVAALNARRLSLPPSLTDRLLAGIVPKTGEMVDQASRANIQANAINGPRRNNGDWTADPTLAGTDRRYERTVAQPPLAPAKSAFNNHDEFVATMLPLAKDAAARIGVDPAVLVAQAALETGWGKSIMRSQDGSSSHNLFGIKAQGTWQGPEARAITSEFRDGKMVKETADFRSYSSYADSFHDLVSLLQNNNRYQGVVKAADNPEQFVKELQKAGYATDPDYASKISQIAKQMKSYQNYAAVPGSSTTL